MSALLVHPLVGQHDLAEKLADRLIAGNAVPELGVTEAHRMTGGLAAVLAIDGGAGAAERRHLRDSYRLSPA